MRIALATAALCVCVAHAANAQATCKLEGVWQLVSGKVDGKPYPTNIRQLKIITKTHFAFVTQEPRAVKDLKSVADTAMAFRTFGAGGGTYKVQGNTYTETLDYFMDPALTGQAVAFTCRTEGDRFYQTGPFPIFENGKKVRELKLEEIWRRVE